jgi:release factor glutamine methyltransferase
MTSPPLPTTHEPRTVGTLVVAARRALEEAGIPNAAQEAQWLIQHALNLTSHHLACGADTPVSDEERARGEQALARRVAREPLQYILGTQEFCGLEFSVSADVLIPRPETELLVQEVVRRGGLTKGATVVDVGTGSGCIAVTLASVLREARVVAIDRSARALSVATANAARHGVDRLIEWLEGDLLIPLAEQGLDGQVDVIVSNPPYIAEADWAGLQAEVRQFEPREALVAGPIGTEVHERLFREARPFLTHKGILLMELGRGQAPLLRRLAEETGGYAPLRFIFDAAGIERVVVAQRIG